MACWVNPGMSVLEGSNVLANRATDISGVVGGGVGNKAGVAEDDLGAITNGVGSGGAVASARGGQQRGLPKPPRPPLPASCASLARDTMARLLLSLLPLLSVEVTKLILTSLNY
jgi:hypothetical protein